MLERISRSGVRMAGQLVRSALSRVLGTVTCVRTDDAVAALTFDDGPHPLYTPALLAILARHRARATFFMTGEAAEQHREIVQRVAAAGHTIGNHSWNHPSFPLVSGRERRAQIRACERVLVPYGSRLFRPPYAEQNLASTLDVLALGYRIVMFNVSTDDWCGGDTASVAEQIERQIHPGCVIVLHDRLHNAVTQSYFNREAVLESVRIVLERVGQRYRFVTVPELLRHGTPQKAVWYKESNIEFLNKLVTEAGPGRRYLQHPGHHWLASLLLGESR